jgi:ADP-heptose:LPS heptosyltransferase
VGDLLCTLPALRAVRRAHPEARVTLVGLPAARWFVARYPDLVDDLLVVIGVPGLPEVAPDPTVARRFYRRAGRRDFDLALQVHGSGVATNPLTTMLGARDQVTAVLPGHWRPPGLTVPYPATGPEIRRLLAVTEAAGCPTVDEATRIPVGDGERAASAALSGASRDDVPYVCLHPGATRADNRWPAGHFAAVGDALAAGGDRVMLTGTAAERPLAQVVAGAMQTAPVDLCGRTDVGTLAALYARARVVVSNDTGAAHVAAAVRAPSVVVFPSDGDLDRWAPLDRRRHRPVATPPGAGRWPRVDDVLSAAQATAGAPA